jgi:hypothetical protein
MLLQEYIADLLTPRIPDGWEEEMQKAQKGNAEDEDEDEVGGEINKERLATSKDVTSDDSDETEDSSE